jgi:hypothetical protein
MALLGHSLERAALHAAASREEQISERLEEFLLEAFNPMV